MSDSDRRTLGMRWDRPPPGTALREFFEIWLPSAYMATARRATAGAPRVRITIAGNTGGAWDMRPEGDRLQVEAQGRDAPDVWVRLSEPDFRAVFDGDPDLPALLPPSWSALDLLFLDPRDVDLLRQVSGRVLLELGGRRARRWSFDVAFGAAGATAGRPRTTVRIDAATFEGMQSGTIPPMQPLLDGRLKVEGDRSLAMQLLLLLGSRLGRS